jgi:hypothetical protein
MKNIQKSTPKTSKPIDKVFTGQILSPRIEVHNTHQSLPRFRDLPTLKDGDRVAQ